MYGMCYWKYWVNGWKRNGWKNSSKEPVKNVDLWQALEDLRSMHDVNFIKVKGHADNEFNNRCDELAVAAITKLQTGELREKKERSTKVQEVFGSLPTLETARLKLRLFKEQDVDDLYEYCSDKEVTRYMPFDTYNTKQEAEERIKYCLESYGRMERPVLWAIEYKENGKLIGGIDFVKWNEESNSAEIGYILNKSYWNKGLMTEAVAEVIKFGFEKMVLNRIEIRCDERNVGSSRVMEKNGLKYEGTLRQEKYLKGEYVSNKVYSILKEEYTK